MRFEPIEMKDKKGRTVVLRNAEVSDAEELIKYLKVTAGETPFLIREPDEVHMTIEQEETFIQSLIDAERELMLIATIEGEHVGNCSLMSMGAKKRVTHRCGVAIALYQKFCDAGIGKLMMQTILEVAKQIGYEQAELEVVSDNTRAISLYEKLGFEKYGCFPNNMKYSDGTYANIDWMMKRL